MPQINLLPWRETLKQERQTRFAILAAIAVGLTVLMWIGAYVYIEGRISYQQKRNDYLKREITAVEQQLKEIEELKSKKTRLIERMNVIQKLQTNRPQIVHLFDEIVKRVPEGVYFTEMVQKGNAIVLTGIAQSDARVSSLMIGLEKSEWLKNPEIIVIDAENTKSSQSQQIQRSISKFELRITLTMPGKEEGSDDNE
jgi:type IV pilus assembly protein PilN